MLTASFESLTAITNASQQALQQQLGSNTTHGAAESTMLEVCSALQQAVADKKAALAQAKEAANAFKSLARRSAQVCCHTTRVPRAGTFYYLIAACDGASPQPTV